MKALIWYLKKLYIGNIKLSSRMNEIEQNEITNSEISDENVICPWITIESKEDIQYFNDFLKDILILKERFNTNKVVIIPFAHLTDKIPNVTKAFDILWELKEFLIKSGFECVLAHFGSAKDIKLYCPADKYQIIHRSYPVPDFIKHK